MKEKSSWKDTLLLKILAVLTAVLIWIIVVNVSDPITECTYSGVTVEILNENLLGDTNETYQVLNDSDNISVTIAAKRSINDLLGKENIRATADMADLNRESGTIAIKLETTKYNDKVESIKGKTKTVEIEVEDLVRKQYRINPVVNGEPSDGYVVGDVVLDQNVVTVQGPASVMEQIDHVTAEASVTGMSGSISTTSSIRYYDADDMQLSASRLTSNISSVSIQVELLATKEVSYNYTIGGYPADGYGVSDDITADPKEVEVAGKSSIVSSLTALTIPATSLDVSGASETKEFKVDLNKILPDGIRLADEDFDGIVVVTVPIEPLQTQVIDIKKSNITISGTEDGKTAVLASTGDVIAISIQGVEGRLEDLDATTIKGEISVSDYMSRAGVSELEAGVYAMPITIELPDGITTTETDVVVQVRIKEKG
ncbi:MAG: hypothetical protein K6G07_04345 [Lachnospiraceae bacterium]|nr:hypothetical protein [Lachnospiraceae bacterium]